MSSQCIAECIHLLLSDLFHRDTACTTRCADLWGQYQDSGISSPECDNCRRQCCRIILFDVSGRASRWFSGVFHLVQIVADVLHHLELEFPLPNRQQSTQFHNTHICPTIKSLSSRSWPAKTSSRAHFAARNLALSPAYHSASQLEGLRLGQTCSPAQYGSVANRSVRHVCRLDGPPSIAVGSGTRKDGTETLADSAFRTELEVTLVAQRNAPVRAFRY
jgi:hypothetical protein